MTAKKETREVFVLEMSRYEAEYLKDLLKGLTDYLQKGVQEPDLDKEIRCRFFSIMDECLEED